MKDDLTKYAFVPYSQMDELLEKVEKLVSVISNSNQQSNSAIGDYITEKEAKAILNKGTTWFWNKRKLGLLKGRKAGNIWYYKKSDILKLIESGKTN